jgi:hypothetical protein
MRDTINRRIFCVLISFALAASVRFAPSARADDNDPSRAQRMIEGMNDQFSELSDAVGGLSADQKPKLDALEATLAAKIKADPTASPATLREPAMEGFRAILTPEQQTKFDKVMAESRRRVFSLLNSNHLKQFGLALIMCSNDHRGDLPASQGALLKYLDAKPDVFLAAGSKNKVPDDFKTMDAAKQADWVDKNSEVIYLAGGKVFGQLPAGSVMAYTKPEAATLGNNFLLSDGSVFQQDEATSKKIIAELTAGTNPPPSLNTNPAPPPFPGK